MRCLIAIVYTLLFTTTASAQSLTEKPMLPTRVPSDWTFEKIIENLWSVEGFIKCDRSDHNETLCLKLNVRREMASVTADLMIDNPEFDNKDYLIEYIVDRYGVVKNVHTYNATGIVIIESFNKRLESINPVPRKALVNNPETHQLAILGVVDYFEISDGKVIVPPSDYSK